MRRPLVSIVVLLALLAGCPPRHAVRDATAYTAEIAAAVARQQDAARQLFIAAERSDDLADCVSYVEPALLIEAAAVHQGNRALWLADLPYVDPTTGTVPEMGVEQDDPGPTPAPRDATEYCNDLFVLKED